MAKSEWKPQRLDELGFVGRGKSRHRPRNAEFLYGGSYPFFQTGDIKEATLYLTEYSQTYSDAGLAQSKLWNTGTLCITIAANIAETAILGIDGCFPDSIVGFIPDPQRADVIFIKYYIDTIKLQMQSVSKGTTQDNLSLDKLLSFDFRVPPLPLQKRIAGILSAYDELIENSQSRIRILETMARTLYGEWFSKTHLSHATSTLGDIVTLERTGINPSAYQGELFDHYSIPAFDNERTPSVELGETILSNKYFIDNTCVLLSKLNPRIPRVWLPAPSGSRRAITSTEFLVLKPKAGFTREFVYAMFCSEQFANQFASLAIGTSTSHQRVKPEALLAISTTAPDSEVVETFTKRIAPLLAMSEQLRSRNRILRQVRDLLLPHLLAGKLS